MTSSSVGTEMEALVGSLVCQAFFDDHELRKETNEIAALLSKLAHGTAADHHKFTVEALAHYVVSSYHAAKAIELLATEARKHAGKFETLGNSSVFLRIHHSFCLEAVVQLNCARSFIAHEPVQAVIGKEVSEHIGALFDNYFPGLSLARHALVHEDERVLGYVKGKAIGDSLEVVQFTMLNGPTLAVKDENGSDLIFKFQPTRHIEFSAEVRKLLASL